MVIMGLDARGRGEVALYVRKEALPGFANGKNLFRAGIGKAANFLELDNVCLILGPVHGFLILDQLIDM